MNVKLGLLTLLAPTVIILRIFSIQGENLIALMAWISVGAVLLFSGISIECNNLIKICHQDKNLIAWISVGAVLLFSGISIECNNLIKICHSLENNETQIKTLEAKIKQLENKTGENK